jgi:hypothetical protein
MNPKTTSLLLLLLAFALSLGVVLLIFWGGWSLGFFLAVILAELVFLGWIMLSGVRQPWPPRKVILVAILATLVADLGLCLFLYDNMLLKLLDTMMILGLSCILYLIAARPYRRGWDEPSFWVEAAVSAIAKPFSSLPDFGRSVASLFRRSRTIGQDSGQNRGIEAAKGTGQDATAGSSASAPAGPAARRLGAGQLAGRILLGLLLAMPVLLIAGAALTSADPIFSALVANAGRIFDNLSLGELLTKLAVALIMLPFIFSFLYGNHLQGNILSDSQAAGIDGFAARARRLDQIVLITFLTCVNIFYLVFAYVQLAYLTGAFTAQLPSGMTYAQYARSGFFELAGMSAINVALVVLAVKSENRKGTAGKILRAESLLLQAGSLVQWASAMFRMRMYVEAYALTILRFMVTAFMILLLVLFILLLIKEFWRSFPLFKSMAAAMLIALIALNHVNSDNWIARFNAAFYQVNQKIDMQYFNALSNDAVPVLLGLTHDTDPKVASDAAAQIIQRYNGLQDYAGGRWQRLNVSESCTRKRIEAQLDDLKSRFPSLFESEQN